MTLPAKLALAAAMLLTVPALSVAGQFDVRDRIRMRAEIGREVRDAVRAARREAWTIRRDAARDAGRTIREARREAWRARRGITRDTDRHRWHDWRD